MKIMRNNFKNDQFMIKDKQRYEKIVQESKNSYIGANISVGVPVVSSVTNVVKAIENLTKANSKEGYINGVTGLGKSSYGVMEATKGILTK